MKKDFVSLAEARPDLAKEWNYEKNGDLKPEDVSCGSGKKVWWKLPYDVPNDYPVGHLRGKHFEFEWEASIGSRAGSQHVGCPYLTGTAVCPGFNDLATINPELAAQWHPTKNGDLKPTQVTANSRLKVWWLLPYDVPLDYPIKPLRGKHFEFEWETYIANRNKYGCPYLTGKAVWPGFNDLATTNPSLADEWDYKLNIGLTPSDVTANSGKKVWWVQYDKSPVSGEMMRLEWDDTIYHRTSGRGNPIKSGRKVLKGYNDLQTLRPDLAKEWNYEKNGDLKPDMIPCGTTRRVWWKIFDKSPVSNNLIELEWEAPVLARTQGTKCPFKCGQKVLKGYNDLQTLRPDLAKEWNYEKNGNLKPDMVTCQTRKKVWWRDFDISTKTGQPILLEWKSSISDRTNGCGNPYKSGKKVLKGYNDLKTLKPDVAKEWNYEKNGNLTPDMFVCNSDKKVWWQCYDILFIDKTPIKLEWRSAIKDRVRAKSNPYKSGKMVLEGYNDLQTMNPELAAQWHPTKNGDLKPTQVTTGSHKKVWWLLSYNEPNTRKHFKFEWCASIYDRNSGLGCPYLTGYKGEEYIKQYLQKNNISFNAQQKFSDLLGTGNGQLSYDFSMPDEKYGYVLVEYNGIQHYEAVDYFGGEEQFKKQKEHDKRKRDYAKKHGYKLITVKYTYDTYESIAEYLDKELKKLGVINDTKKEEFINDAA